MNHFSNAKAGSKFAQCFDATECEDFEDVAGAAIGGQYGEEQAKQQSYAKQLGRLDALPEDGAADYCDFAQAGGRPALYVDLRNVRQGRAPYIPPDSSKSDQIRQIRSVQSYDLPKQKSQLKNLSNCEPEY